MADVLLHFTAVYDQHPAAAVSKNAAGCKEQPRRTACAAPRQNEVIDLINDDDDEDEQDIQMPYDAGPAARWMPGEGAGARPTPRPAAEAAAPDGPPWWTVLPDFVPVVALRDGRDPRCGSQVKI